MDQRRFRGYGSFNTLCLFSLMDQRKQGDIWHFYSIHPRSSFNPRLENAERFSYAL